MTYTIGEVSKKLHIPTSTIRYYDNLGLLCTLQRSSGKRLFTHDDIDRLATITCLKNTGMTMAKIQEFIDLYSLEPNSVKVKYSMIATQKQIVEEKIETLKHNLEHSEFKLWFFLNKVENGEEPHYSEESFESWQNEFYEWKKNNPNPVFPETI